MGTVQGVASDVAFTPSVRAVQAREGLRPVNSPHRGAGRLAHHVTPDQRIKIWGETRVIEDDDALIARLMPNGYPALPEQAIVFALKAWDVNCSQPFPLRFDAADVAAALIARDWRIAELEADIARLRTGGAGEIGEPFTPPGARARRRSARRAASRAPPGR